MTSAADILHERAAGLRARMTTALDARINAAIQSNSLDVTCQEAKGVL